MKQGINHNANYGFAWASNIFTGLVILPDIYFPTYFFYLYVLCFSPPVVNYALYCSTRAYLQSREMTYLIYTSGHFVCLFILFIPLLHRFHYLDSEIKFYMFLSAANIIFESVLLIKAIYFCPNKQESA